MASACRQTLAAPLQKRFRHQVSRARHRAGYRDDVCTQLSQRVGLRHYLRYDAPDTNIQEWQVWRLRRPRLATTENCCLVTRTPHIQHLLALFGMKLTCGPRALETSLYALDLYVVALGYGVITVIPTALTCNRKWIKRTAFVTFFWSFKHIFWVRDVRDAETVMIPYDFIALVSHRARKSTGRMISVTANMDGLLREAQMPFNSFEYHPISALQPPVEDVLYCIVKAAVMLKVLFDYRLLLRAQENWTYIDLSTWRACSNWIFWLGLTDDCSLARARFHVHTGPVQWIVTVVIRTPVITFRAQLRSQLLLIRSRSRTDR